MRQQDDSLPCMPFHHARIRRSLAFQRRSGRLRLFGDASLCTCVHCTGQRSFQPRSRPSVIAPEPSAPKILSSSLHAVARRLNVPVHAYTSTITPSVTMMIHGER